MTKGFDWSVETDLDGHLSSPKCNVIVKRI